MPNGPSFPFSELLEQIAAASPGGVTLYLVGGAVRDALLGRSTHDLDFVLAGDVLRFARGLADRLGAAFYPLDEARHTGRLVLSRPGGRREKLDFARLQGPDLESDLRARDFTINAMAIDIRRPQELLDPLHGAADLHAKKLRACSPTSLADDPLRILRAVRQAAAFGLQVDPETRSQMRQAVARLPGISPERVRDELFRILDGSLPAVCLRALDQFGALPYVLPELPALKGVDQPLPHIDDVWDHTLAVLQRLEGVLAALGPAYDPDTAANLPLGLAVLRLGRFREPLGGHMDAALNPERSLRALLFLAALYHDIAKPLTRSVEAGGRIRFIGHDLEGARVVEERARALRLSNVETERLKTIVRQHMRPGLLAQAGQPPTRRAIYRFFRDTGPAGVDICLLSLADTLATHGPALPPESWAIHLDVVRALLEAWWERPEESISPPALINGVEMMAELGLSPGPQVGRLLEAVREAQATGRVSTREEALALARKLSLNPEAGDRGPQG
jgi:putative nucleotidyltransferase with HDIG domain